MASVGRAVPELVAADEPAPAEGAGPVELPVPVDPVVVPLLVLALLPVVEPVAGLARTCLVTLSQHLPVWTLEAPGEVEGVWATATPTPPASSAAAAIKPILVIAAPLPKSDAALCHAMT